MEPNGKPITTEPTRSVAAMSIGYYGRWKVSNVDWKSAVKEAA